MKVILSLLLILFPVALFAALPLGSTPKEVALSGDEGGLVVGGGAWASSSLKGKMSLIFYVDPDKKDVNDEATQELKKYKTNKTKFQSYAIINMAATWKPNAIISAILKGKQEEFPNTIYVQDMEKKLVREWGLEDDNSDVLLLDADLKVLFSQDGKLGAEDIQKLVELIQAYAAP